MRFQQISKAAEHLRKVDPIDRWRQWFIFQGTVYEEYLRGMQRRYPRLSDKEIIAMHKRRVMQNKGKSIY
ncbi:MAG: hypothetical protein GPJ54_01650 [Candidatus Heimdallarchaeota archaeon]|nr:hypothetical protein [Candidatus Heimdallarchaeota archaeon]